MNLKKYIICLGFVVGTVLFSAMASTELSILCNG